MNTPQPEPNWLLQSLAIFGVPYLAYFLGIVIRKVALPGKKSPPLAHQFLIGVPVSLVIVSPVLAFLHTTLSTDIGTYLFTIGIIVEHGMLVQETATRHLRSDNRRDLRVGKQAAQSV